jgi:hypothetical protein
MRIPFAKPAVFHSGEVTMPEDQFRQVTKTLESESWMYPLD